ncbi:hypothetical protein ACMBCN_02825 [Candidatus Liberibacter asiaticus]
MSIELMNCISSNSVSIWTSFPLEVSVRFSNSSVVNSSSYLSKDTSD